MLGAGVLEIYTEAKFGVNFDLKVRFLANHIAEMTSVEASLDLSTFEKTGPGIWKLKRNMFLSDYII